MAHYDHRVAEYGVGLSGKHDQPVRRQALESDLGGDGVRVGRRQHRHGAMLPEWCHAEAGRRCRQTGDDSVQPPLTDFVDESERGPSREVDVDARRGAGEPAQRARHARGERVGQLADAQPHRCQVASVARDLLRDFGVPQHVPRLLEQGDARDGELRRPRR